MKRVRCAFLSVLVCAAVAMAQTQARTTTSVAAKPAPAAATPAAKPAPRALAPQSASNRRPAAASAAHKPASGTAAVKGTTTRTGTANGSHAGGAASKPASARRGRKTPAKHRQPRQLVPAPERYKEIQQALASKGYLKPEDASGTWDQSSSDALKRFQSEQKLQGTGKIDSLSLIALGLGPKHDATVTRPVPPDGTGQSAVQNP